MKKNIFFILFLVPILVYSQNWNLFNFNQKSYYAQTINANTLKVESYNADSIKNGEYQTIYFNRKLGISDECYNNITNSYSYNNLSLTKSNVIDSLIVKGDTVLYIAKYNSSDIDTFLFLPNCELNATWQTTRNHLTVTCTEITTENILGLVDSVKVFSVSSDLFDGVHIKLSKTFGLIEFFPLIVFLKQETGIAPPLKLIGYEKDNTQRGYVQPKFKDYFHLKKDDKLYWKSYYFSGAIPVTKIIKYEIDKVLNVELTDSTVKYQVQKTTYNKHGIVIGSNQGSYVYAQKYEGKLLEAPTSKFVALGDVYEQRKVNFTNSLILKIENNDTITTYESSFSGTMLHDNCVVGEMTDTYDTKTYSTREGLTYEGYSNFSDSYIKLIGSIIDGVASGTTVVAIDEIEEPKICIYPNPTFGIINIKTVDKIEKITVIDILGKVVLSKVLNSNSTEANINIENQEQGAYIIKVQTQTGNIEKIIIKK